PETDLGRLGELFDAARAAQREWAALSFAQRATHIRRMRDYITANADEIARTVSLSNGKTRTDALATEVLPCALACNWYAKHAGRILRPRRRAAGSLLFINKRTEV